MSRDPEHHKPDKKNLEHEKEGILNEDKFIGDLASTIGGITESTYSGAVNNAIMDFNIVDDIRNHLIEDPNYEPSDEEIQNNPRIAYVWREAACMRMAVTDPKSPGQAEGYGSILDDLGSKVEDISSSRRDAAAKAAEDAAKLAASIGMPTRTPARFTPPSTASHPYSQPDILAVPPVPGTGTADPDVDPANPQRGTADPDVDPANPQRGTADPDVDPANPQRGTADPDVDPANPQRGTADPDVDPANPQRGTADPDVDPANPQRGTADPDVDPANPQRGTADPDVDPANPQRGPRSPETRAEKEARRKKLEEELARLNEELDAPYAAKLDEYARLLAKEESKRADGGFRFSIMHWVGGPGNNRKREKRREALDEAGKALKKEVLAYLHQKVKTKRQNGEYQGTDDEIAQQMSDEMFDEQRKIFGQRLQERKDEILRSESDKLRNRILAKIGSWIGMEKSTKNSLKAAAVGVGHGLVKGAAVGALTGLFGVTWPISVGVSIVAAAVGDRMIRRGVRLDAIRRGLGGQNGSRQLVDDDKFARIKEKAEGKKRSQEFMADKMLKLSRKDSYAAGDRLSKETNERLNKHKVALGIGRLAGGAVGGLGGRWVGQQLHDHTPVGQAVDSAKRNVHEFIHREDTAAAAAEREYQGKIDELNRRIDELNNRLERAAAGNIDNSGSFSNWEYPWDWAVDQFGENNAISKLYELADAAARDGHNIQWHGYGDTQWLSIDGKSDTATVLETLAKYMKDDYGLAA